jgi:hypothetical protein
LFESHSNPCIGAQLGVCEFLPKYSESSRNSLKTRVFEVEDRIVRGVGARQFCSRVNRVDLHLMISALCFHRVAKPHAFTGCPDAIRPHRDAGTPSARAAFHAALTTKNGSFVRAAVFCIPGFDPFARPARRKDGKGLSQKH